MSTLTSFLKQALISTIFDIQRHLQAGFQPVTCIHSLHELITQEGGTVRDNILSGAIHRPLCVPTWCKSQDTSQLLWTNFRLEPQKSKQSNIPPKPILFNHRKTGKEKARALPLSSILAIVKDLRNARMIVWSGTRRACQIYNTPLLHGWMRRHFLNIDLPYSTQKSDHVTVKSDVYVSGMVL